MADSTEAGSETSGSADALEGIAIELITDFVQEAFLGLDPLQRVRQHAPHLSAADQQAVADLIDNAEVEFEIGFGTHDHPHDDH